MNQTLAINKKYPAQHRRFNCRNSIAIRPSERQRQMSDMLWPTSIDRFHSDWFALRLGEDDGGGPSFTTLHGNVR